MGHYLVLEFLVLHESFSPFDISRMGITEEGDILVGADWAKSRFRAQRTNDIM
jgi:hypothetical protein